MTNRCCPVCRLPIPAPVDGGGWAFGTSREGVHGVTAICGRCTSTAHRIPNGAAQKMLRRATEKSLHDTERHWSACFPSADLAQLAGGMLQHPRLRHEAAKAFGWGDGIDPRKKTP